MKALSHARIADTCWTHDVYPPSDDSFALVDALAKRLQSRTPLPTLCLEVGCGSGFVCTSLALMLEQLGHKGYRVVATDVNGAAAQCTVETAAAHGVGGKVEVMVTSFWDGLRHPYVTSDLDLILFNPPYVPTPETELGGVGLSASWAGGEYGRHIIDPFLERITPLLELGRVEVLMVTVAANAPMSIVEEMMRQGFKAEVVLQRHVDEEHLSVVSIRRDVPSPSL